MKFLRLNQILGFLIALFPIKVFGYLLKLYIYDFLDFEKKILVSFIIFLNFKLVLFTPDVVVHQQHHHENYLKWKNDF